MNSVELYFIYIHKQHYINTNFIINFTGFIQYNNSLQ